MEYINSDMPQSDEKEVCDMSKVPRIFISYSHDSEKHKAWVLNLSTRLRKNGVDVVLDQ